MYQNNGLNTANAMMTGMMNSYMRATAMQADIMKYRNTMDRQRMLDARYTEERDHKRTVAAQTSAYEQKRDTIQDYKDSQKLRDAVTYQEGLISQGGGNIAALNRARGDLSDYVTMVGGGSAIEQATPDPISFGDLQQGMSDYMDNDPLSGNKLMHIGNTTTPQETVTAPQSAEGPTDREILNMSANNPIIKMNALGEEYMVKGNFDVGVTDKPDKYGIRGSTGPLKQPDTPLQGPGEKNSPEAIHKTVGGVRGNKLEVSAKQFENANTTENAVKSWLAPIDQAY